MVRVGGPVRRIADAAHGVFTGLRATPEQAKTTYTKPRVLALVADRPLHRPQLAQLARAAHNLAAHVLVMIPTGDETNGDRELRLPTAALVRSVLAAKDRLPTATVLTVPLSKRGDRLRDGLLTAKVAKAYGATHLMTGRDGLGGGEGVRSMVPRELAYDTRDGQWRPIEDIEPPFRRTALSDAEIADMLDRGLRAAGVAHAAECGRGAAQGAAAAAPAGPGAVLHGPVGLGEVRRSPAGSTRRCWRRGRARCRCSTATWYAGCSPAGWASRARTGR